MRLGVLVFTPTQKPGKTHRAAVAGAALAGEVLAGKAMAEEALAGEALAEEVVLEGAPLGGRAVLAGAALAGEAFEGVFTEAVGRAVCGSQTHSCVYLSLRAGLAAGEARIRLPGRVRPSMLPELLLCTHSSSPFTRNSTLKRLRRCTKPPITQPCGTPFVRIRTL